MRSPPTTKNSHKKTVFVWGTFDLLHAGHIEYLIKARALGDTLIVAVFSDAVVSRLNDKTCPFVPQAERMEILSALSIVDCVTLLTKRSPIQMVEKTTPDIIASCDLADDTDLSDAVSRLNLKFVRIKLRARTSTTDIIQKIKAI